MLVLLAAVATGAVAQNYTITLPSVSNGSVTAKVNDTPVTSAAAGETVSLVATPDAGYGLKSISGTYQVTNPQETLSKGAATRTGSYFTLNASYSNSAGWNLYSNSTVTITTNDTGKNIGEVVLNITPKASFAFNQMSVNHGSMTRDGNVITITGINSNSVTIQGTSSGGAYGCVVTSATITGSGVFDNNLTLTSTGDDNVKTFTMPSGNVTISAEFESAVVAVNSITLSQTEATLTLGETETVTLTATVLPGDATDKSVTWSSSNEAVATVADGVVTAVAAGEATITVTTTDGAKTATCAVTVAAPANACGDGVTWALDNGVLTISYAGSGTGAMADFTESWESNPIPWKDNLYDITSIVIEEGVTSIGKMAFKDCDMLTSVSIPATVTSIGENAFANSGSPSGMTVTIAAGSTLETIGTYAFMRSKLASINLPNGVTTIGDFAFAVCEKLASFTWPSSLTSIGIRAFQRTALTTVEIPASVTSIGELAFMACSSLATITVADGNSAYEAPNGCNAIIDKNSHTLIQGCSGTVFEILPADLTTIGYASCSYFGFTSVTIPDGVTTIGEHAFEGCSDLTTVEIPASVTSIGEYAFGWCGSLATVTVYAEPTCALGDEAFYDCSSLAAIYVPSDKVNDFKTATGWSAYESIIDAIPAPATYTVTLKEGTEDATSWTIAPAEATTTGVAAGTTVTASYGGVKKVKSVKAVKKAKPAATVTTAPTAKTGVKAGEDVAIVNEGAAEGGTMMYMVNATQPASTDGFSATVPTAEGLTAGTYYVWYYVKADDSHTDSEISASGIEVTIAAAETTVTWTSSDMTSNFYANFDGWTNNNTHQGITVTGSGDAQGGWSQNGIDVNEGSGTITFTSSVGNIKSIVITADNMNNIDEWHVPAGWTANNTWDNPRTLSWNGTASTTVNLPLSNGQNFSNISTIVFTLE